MSALTEFFLLRGARELAASMKPETRTEVEHALRLGRQKLQAAEALWSNGGVAEAMRLAAQSMIVVTDTLAATEPDRSFSFEIVRGMLLRAGLTQRRIDAIEKAYDLRKTYVIPTLDEEADSQAPAVFRQWVQAQERVLRALEPAIMSKAQSVLLRVSRWSVLALVLIGISGAAAYLLTRTPADSINGSGTFGGYEKFEPMHAMDRNDASWWLAPDSTPGWLDVRLGRARRVSHVRLLNSSSPPWNDRGTKDYTLEIFRAGRLVKSIPGTFATGTHPGWVTHRVDVDGVDRVRFVARTWYNKGVALAEIRVE